MPYYNPNIYPIIQVSQERQIGSVALRGMKREKLAALTGFGLSIGLFQKVRD